MQGARQAPTLPGPVEPDSPRAYSSTCIPAAALLLSSPLRRRRQPAHRGRPPSCPEDSSVARASAEGTDMARFRQTVLSTCWLMPILSTFYFWAVALSMFSALRSSEPSTNPSSAPTWYTQEATKKTMATCIWWMTALVICSVSILFYVRTIVEAAADAETNGNSFEEEAHKLAREELKQAIKAIDVALATLAALAKPTSDVKAVNEYVKAVGMRNVAIAKAERTKPKEGLARLPRARQVRVRLLFFLVVFLFFWAGVCAAVAFHFSLRLQIGCDDGVMEIAPFVLAGLISLSVHVQAARAAFTED